MSSADILRFAAGALLRHRLRSLLSLTGVTIGVAAVVVLTALGEGALRYVTGQFESIGSNLLIVIPGKVETTGGLPGIGGAPNDLTLADARALEDAGIAAIFVHGRTRAQGFDGTVSLTGIGKVVEAVPGLPVA